MHQPINDYPQEAFLENGGNVGTYRASTGNAYGSAPLRLRIPVTRHYPGSPANEGHCDLEGLSGGREGPQHFFPEAAWDTASEGTSPVITSPEVVRDYTANGASRDHKRPILIDPDFNYAVRHGWKMPDDMNSTPAPLLNYAITSNGVRHGYPTVDEGRALTSPTPNHFTFNPPPCPLRSLVTQGEQRDGEIQSLAYAGRSDIKGPGSGGPENGGDTAELFNYHTTVSPSGRDANETDPPDRAVPGRRAQRRKLNGKRESTMPVSGTITHGSRRFKLVKQTLYDSATRQASWSRQSPIDFGWTKFADVAKPKNSATVDHDEVVLNHHGIGSTILCRLNFGGDELGKSKISVTNHKSIRQPITKKKLAFEVAKLVERHINAIKAQPGCTDVTFENIFLRKLHHVSKASWQPEIWYEVTTPGPNSS